MGVNFLKTWGSNQVLCVFCIFSIKIKIFVCLFVCLFLQLLGIHWKGHSFLLPISEVERMMSH
jgi:hypothetical protein